MKTQETATTPPPNFSQVNGPITFDGGTLNLGPNAATSASMIATQFIINSNGASFQSGFSGRNLTLQGTLTGVGDILIFGNGGTRVVTFTNLLSYTGDIRVTQDMGIAFGIDYTFTGGLDLTTAASSLKVQNGQTLTFTQGKLVDFVNGAVAEGTYTGTSLAALGANYQDFGGTIVVTAVPEPSVALLAALGVLGLLRRRRN
ncbi:PEP-CTERM sorting domain-containing protein [Akkermansiaceae bacterium]|nr:PEP-CTERM sorting domain-containing protein [Akkermansiaceae bacterium]